jgi:pectate lyase/pectin methylesterase-like acyl-CoA thioesterase/lysophospholipase L1-like esterase
MKRYLSLFAALAALVLPVRAAEPLPVRVILVGDSTMASKSGYGDALCQRMRPETRCINLARGGRSSSSFRAEGRWDEVQALLADHAWRATYVLVQFGHNDQPGKPGRSTDLVTQFPANMARYAQEVRAGGAVPILVTPLTRRSFKGPWLQGDLAPWAAATRQVAANEHAALLDLNALSAAAVQKMGSAEADTLAPAPPGAPGFDRTHLGAQGAALFSAMVADELRRIDPLLAGALRAQGEMAAIPEPDWLHERAPADGWGGGARGGSEATAANTVVVASRADLLAALARKADSRIVLVSGIIDMSEGRPFASSADQGARGTVSLGSNTSLIGMDAKAGFVNANIRIADASQVIVRNLHLQNPCDVGPVWDPKDGAKGNWNSLYDGITLANADHVWIDHNSFTDAPWTDDRSPVELGMLKQCHDGALDITKGSDFVTVSYNHFALHEKNMLIGSGDRATGDEGHLKVTLHHNLFENVSARNPRVRFGQVHLYNNYHVGDKAGLPYPHEYSIGVGRLAKIIADNNAFDIAGAKGCRDIVHNYDGTPPTGALRDTGSLLNGGALGPCTQSADVGWNVPYPFSPLPAKAVKAHVERMAGAGKLELPAARVLSVAPNGEAHADTLLRIEFDRPGGLGADSVRIYRVADNALADEIHAGLETDELPAGEARRRVRRELLQFAGGTVTVRPHSARLAPGTDYRVQAGAASWSFRTLPAVPAKDYVTVAAEGPADFRTIQGAIDHVTRHVAKTAPAMIRIAKGRYEELLFVSGKDKLTLTGAGRDEVIVEARNNGDLNAGTDGRALLLAEQADLLTLHSLTIRNTSRRADSKAAQAEALFFNSDAGRLVARDAAFFSEQDTLHLNGYAWFYRTLVAGNVDFIWGASHAALFEESEIRSVGDSAGANPGGYVVQARTPSRTDPGYVFLNSTLTHGAGPAGNDIAPGATFLARSGGKPGYWDNVSFIGCKMDVHIAAAGWAGSGAKFTPAPNPAAADANSGWREFGSTDLQGQALDLSRRAAAYLLLPEEASRLFSKRATIFAAFDNGRGWYPAP